MPSSRPVVFLINATTPIPHPPTSVETPLSPQKKQEKKRKKQLEEKQTNKQTNNNNNNKKKSKNKKQVINCGTRTCDSGLQPYTCVTGA